MIRKGRQLPPLSPNYRYDVVKTKHLQRDRSGNLVVHNLPSGDPTLSQADIHMTKAIVQIATPLGISVHDHIIVGRNGHASLKGMQLIWPVACIYHLLTIRFALW